MLMDLTTTYLGLKLRHAPRALGLAALGRKFDGIKRMEDAGASAVVLYSLFEAATAPGAPGTEPSHGKRHVQLPEAADLFSGAGGISAWGPRNISKHIAEAKKAVRIPIIASINASVNKRPNK